MKINWYKLICWFNTVLNSFLMTFSFVVFFQGFSKYSRCEFCTLMIFPAIVFLIFSIYGIQSLIKSNIRSGTRFILNFVFTVVAILAVGVNIILSSD